MALTEKERLFLAKQELSDADVSDDPLLTVRERKAAAKADGLPLYLGQECERGGHRLRTRSGHCAQCNPSALAYQSRHSQSGYVYIAGSLECRLIKVGGTGSILHREETLQEQAYAGAGDWKILFSVKVARYGFVERGTQRFLRARGWEVTDRFYVKDGKTQRATEIFRCRLSPALIALRENLKGASVTEWHEEPPEIYARYEF